MISDVERAHKIFGLNPAGLREKKVRWKLEQIIVDCAQIPWVFIQVHKYDASVAIVMFVTWVTFLVISHGVYILSQ